MPKTPATAQPAVNTGLGWLPALGVFLAAAFPALHQAYWAMPLSAMAAWGAIGIWRAVRFLSLTYQHLHWRDVEVPAQDDD